MTSPQIQTRDGLQSSECQYDYDYKAKQGSRGVDPPIHKPSARTDHESAYHVEENQPKQCKTQPDYQQKQSKTPSTKAQQQPPPIQLPPSQNLMSSLLSVQYSFDPDDSLQNNRRHPNEPSQPGENQKRDSERVCSSRKRGRWSFERGLQITDANSFQNFGFPQSAKSLSLIQQNSPNEPSQPRENRQQNSQMDRLGWTNAGLSFSERAGWSFERGLQIADANSLQNFGFPQAAKSPSLIQQHSPSEPSQPRENPQQDPQMDRRCWTGSGGWSFRRGLQLTNANSLQNFRDPQSAESPSLIQQNNPNNPQTVMSSPSSSDVPSNPWPSQGSNSIQGNALSIRRSKKFKKLWAFVKNFK